MRCQAIRTTIRKLEEVIKELKQDKTELNKSLHIKNKIDKDRKHLILIKNKSNCFDTWFID